MLFLRKRQRSFLLLPQQKKAQKIALPVPRKSDSNIL